MKPIYFKESTNTLSKPKNMTDEQCKPLPIYTDGKECISCWKPSFKEKLCLLFGAKIWLGVLCGHTQPPVRITIKKNIFK